MATVPEARSDPEFRQLEAVLYWELRRWLFNVVLVPAAYFDFVTGIPFLLPPSLPSQLGTTELLARIGVWVIGANAGYSLVYALDLLLGRHAKRSPWKRAGRGFALFAITTLAVILAAHAGRTLAGWPD